MEAGWAAVPTLSNIFAGFYGGEGGKGIKKINMLKAVIRMIGNKKYQMCLLEFDLLGAVCDAAGETHNATACAAETARLPCHTVPHDVT